MQEVNSPGLSPAPVTEGNSTQDSPLDREWSATPVDSWATSPANVHASTGKVSDPWNRQAPAQEPSRQKPRTALFDSNSEIESEILNNIWADNSIDIDSFAYQDCFFESLEKNIEISDTSVKGRLKHCYEFWEKNIDANDEILSIINQGYVIPFISEPPVFYMKNNRSACKNSEFVEKSIKDLIKNNCVYETPFKPHNVNPLSVAVNNSSGKKRLILDLSVLNNYVKKRKG